MGITTIMIIAVTAYVVIVTLGLMFIVGASHSSRRHHYEEDYTDMRRIIQNCLDIA